jgi:putative FmdB family regulatory protein
MPLYEYECKKCHHRFERIQKFSDPHVTKCPKCKGPIEQLISAPAVQFKGSGWYVTDYAKGANQSASNGESSSKDGKAKTEKAADDKSDSKKSKSEGKSESKSESSKADSTKSGSSSKPKADKK